LGILDLGSNYQNRVLRWAGHVARKPMSRAPRQLLTSWVARPRPAQESAETQRPPHGLRNVERHRPRQAKVAAAETLYADAQPSGAQPSDVQPSDVQPPTPSPPTRNQPLANPNAPLPGYSNLAPAYVVPTWNARYPTILRKISRSTTEEEDSEYFFNYL
jgi:hypothetical protein